MTTNSPSDALAPDRRRRRLRIAAIAAVTLIPLAFAGLYMAAVGSGSESLDQVPAAIVNQDQMVTQTNTDGTSQPILAGRQLVTELTGTKSPGLNWKLSNAAQAKKQLASGEVYAVLTIPKDFTKSVLSLSGSDPERAQIAITTDDAHSYLAGTLAKSLGDGMVRTFGTAITENYITGLTSGLGTVGDSLQTAADGAKKLAGGASAASTGASTYASGVTRYTGGVGSLATGLEQLSSGAKGLTQLGGGFTQLTAALTAATAALATDPSDPVALAKVQGISAQLSALAKTNAGAIGGVQGGIAQSASGARQLANNGYALASGASGLAAGTAKLASGAGSLAAGLQTGADKISGSGAATSADAAKVAADPVALTVTTVHPVSKTAQVVATFLVPLGLWVGALGVFLIMRPISRRLLGSSAPSGRLVGRTLGRAGIVAGIQALLLVVLMHTAAGVSWTLLPATLVFSLLVAGAFTAFHYLLTIGLGRAGLIISLFLLAVQIAAIGGIVPIQALSAPFAAISPYLPLSWASTGLQQIVTGGSAAVAIGQAFALLVFGLASVGVAMLAVRRTRRAHALGLVLPA